MEEYVEYWDTRIYDESYVEAPESTFYQTCKLCLEPTIHEMFPHVWKLLLFNVIFRLATQIKILPKYICHICSTLCGIAVIYFTLRSSLLYLTIFTFFCYVTLNLCQYFSTKYWTFYLSIFCTTYLIVSEFYFPLQEAWNETRGLHMVIAMKVISIAFDYKKGSIKYIPNIIEYLGYVLCPSNCLFGPWVSLNTYKSVFNCQNSILDWKWAKQIIVCTLIAIIFLTLSNCWAYWLIPQTWKWSVAYQEAFSFRSSHYFISYLSEAAMVAGGYGYSNINSKKKKETSWSFLITRPTAMEFPRSLVQVVVYWNIPMHMWLKNYVFLVCKPMGSFFAVTMTYVTSSFLHGFNLRLAAVLLSLGFYTYIEYKLRYKLMIIFDACIGANPCRKCDHKYKSNFYVWLANFMFTVIAVFHLAYLGCLLESTSDIYERDSEVFLKWQHLDFSSHLFTASLYLIYKLI